MAKKTLEVNEYYVRLRRVTNGNYSSEEGTYVVAPDPREAMEQLIRKDFSKTITEIYVYDSGDDFTRNRAPLTFEQYPHGIRS